MEVARDTFSGQNQPDSSSTPVQGPGSFAKRVAAAAAAAAWPPDLLTWYLTLSLGGKVSRCAQGSSGVVGRGGDPH